MDAPTCRICGEKHWSRVCDGNDAVTKRVTSKPDVTVTVTPRQADLEIENRALRAEVERLTEEVKSLKRAAARTDVPQTVGATVSARRPMTSAERVAKHRLAARDADRAKKA